MIKNGAEFLIGPKRLPQDLNPSVLDRLEEAKAGPLTGAAPSDVN